VSLKVSTANGSRAAILARRVGNGERSDQDETRIVAWKASCSPGLAATETRIGDDRIRSFDVYRVRVLGLSEAIAVASPARREELCRIVIERVVVNDRQVEAIEWTPPVRPFFEKQRECPQGDSNP
jgi:hypothetical protein